MKALKVIKSGARIVAGAGLALVGIICDKAGIRDLGNKMPVSVAHPQNVVSEGDVIVSTIGMMCLGSNAFESVRDYNGDPDFYKEALGIDDFLSPERLRQRLDQNGKAVKDGLDNHDDIREMNIALLKKNGAPISPLPMGDVPVDCDVTPYDESKSHKEGISRTYKGFDGYAPMDAHIGTEGYFLNTDFRGGKDHSQNGTENFLIECIDMANRLTPNTLLFRMDSGNDCYANMGIIMDRGHHFIIKRNLRKESKTMWLEKAEQFAPIHYNPREGKDVYIGSDWRTIFYMGMDEKLQHRTVRIVYEVTKRTIDKKGQVLMFPEIDVNTYWDNTGCPDETVIELYHQHGTMEQFHSELKTDMDLERLPSGKFATNCLVHELSMLAYNTLRIIGDVMCDIDITPMRGKAERRRLRTVILHIIRIPARVISTGRSTKIDVGSSNEWSDTFIELNRRLTAA